MDDACHPRVLDCGGRSRRAGGDTAFACHQRTRYHLKRAPTSTNACRHTRMARHNHPPDRNQRHVGDLTHHASKLYVKEQTGPMPLRKERRHPAHGMDRITHLIYIPFRKSQALFSPFLRLANDDARSRLSIFISHPYPLAARRSPPRRRVLQRHHRAAIQSATFGQRRLEIHQRRFQPVENELGHRARLQPEQPVPGPRRSHAPQRLLPFAVALRTRPL